MTFWSCFAVSFVGWLVAYWLGRNHGRIEAARELRKAIEEDGVFPRRDEVMGQRRARERRREREKGGR